MYTVDVNEIDYTDTKPNPLAMLVPRMQVVVTIT